MAPRNLVNSLSRTAVAVTALMVAVAVTIGVSMMIDSFRHTVVVWLDADPAERHLHLRADLHRHHALRRHRPAGDRGARTLARRRSGWIRCARVSVAARARGRSTSPPRRTPTSAPSACSWRWTAAATPSGAHAGRRGARLGAAGQPAGHCHSRRQIDSEHRPRLANLPR